MLMIFLVSRIYLLQLSITIGESVLFAERLGLPKNRVRKATSDDNQRERATNKMTRRYNHLSVLLLVLLLLATLLPRKAAALPSLQRMLPRQLLLRKKEYTPLLFFKVPKGYMPECDALEAAVRQVERELGVRVERMDVLRNPANEAVLALLTKERRTPPLLYHRESRQMVYLTPAKGDADPKKKVHVNKDRVRAWAKGRYLTSHSAAMEDGGGAAAASKVAAPQLLQSEEESAALDQAELLEEMALTPEQLKGKRLIQERTKAKAGKKKKKKKKKEESPPTKGKNWVESPM